MTERQTEHAGRKLGTRYIDETCVIGDHRVGFSVVQFVFICFGVSNYPVVNK